MRPKLEGVAFDRIDEDLSNWLERPFTEEEVMGALKFMEDDKVPDPDGFLQNF